MQEIKNLEDLRLFATCYVEFCNNSPNEKSEFINFINEANEKQISYLLYEGIMTKNKEIFCEKMGFVDTAKFIKHMQGTGAATQYVAGQTLPIAAVLAGITYAAIKIYKNYLSKAAKACSGKKGEEKKSCMEKFKKDAIKQKIKYLEAGKPRCKHSKDPKTCVAKLDLKIAKAKQNLSK